MSNSYGTVHSEPKLSNKYALEEAYIYIYSHILCLAAKKQDKRQIYTEMYEYKI